MKKDRIGHILTRSNKKELFREKYFKVKKLNDGDTKDKRADRLNAALRKTQQDKQEHNRDGQEYYNNTMKELNFRQEQVQRRERAKSAHHYNSC